jgi:imidazole glycerol-phosphate synthase subunit HisH
MQPGTYAYFNHSFYCANTDPADTAARTEYGFEFSSAVQRENIYGVQFHPEKSQRVGQQVLENFFKV